MNEDFDPIDTVHNAGVISGKDFLPIPWQYWYGHYSTSEEEDEDDSWFAIAEHKEGPWYIGGPGRGAAEVEGPYDFEVMKVMLRIYRADGSAFKPTHTKRKEGTTSS